MARCVRIAFALALALALAAGCDMPPGAVAFTPLEGEKAESQWDIRIMDGGVGASLTGAMAVSVANPDEARLYLMLPMGQTVGRCVLSGGKASCEASVPESDALVRRAAEPMAKMLSVFALHGDDVGPQHLRGPGWRCELASDALVYREDGAKWTVRIRRTK